MMARGWAPVWDAATGQKLCSFEGHDAPVYSVYPHYKESVQFIYSTSKDPLVTGLELLGETRAALVRHLHEQASQNRLEAQLRKLYRARIERKATNGPVNKHKQPIFY